MPKVIGRFHEKHPLTTVKLAIADTNEIESRVFKGELELGVIGSKSSHAGFMTVNYGKMNWCWLFPTNINGQVEKK